MNITCEEFKEHFPRFTPSYLPAYEDRIYNKDEVVFYLGQFYRCLHNGVNTLPTEETDWEIYADSPLNYTRDEDINNACNEAALNFNEGLFSSCCQAKLVFMYLVAYYLTVDFQNASGSASNGGIVQSKSVGSVSEGYAIPQWMLNNATLSPYATNGYGRKYLSLIKPYLVGNIIISRGATTP